MTLAVCPGSFDPITLGHVDVIRRSAALMDEVIVGVAHNHKKSHRFTAEQRAQLARAALADIPNVRVAVIDGLLADFCQEVGAQTIIKGLRGTADFDNEQTMALLNRHLSGVETLFMLGDPGLNHISSSFVKDIAGHGGPIEDLVPPGVARALQSLAPGENR